MDKVEFKIDVKIHRHDERLGGEDRAAANGREIIRQ